MTSIVIILISLLLLLIQSHQCCSFRSFGHIHLRDDQILISQPLAAKASSSTFLPSPACY